MDKSENNKIPQDQIENDIIFGSNLETLYCRDVGFNTDLKELRLISSDCQEKNFFEIQTAPRTSLKVFYHTKDNDLKEFEIVKCVKNGKGIKKERLKFSQLNFSHLVQFFDFLKNHNLAEISQRKLKLLDDSLDKIDSQTKLKIGNLLKREEGKKIVEELIKSGLITDKDIINTHYRKEQLEIFRKLLEKDKNFWTQYRDQEADAFINAKKEEQNSLEKACLKITKVASEEKTWQYFFTKNQWIFGYGLDYRFQGILQREAQTTDGGCVDGKSGDGFCDYLLADKKFISFVEIKTPNTELFDVGKNRSGSWKLSEKLIDAYSQILEQKASGQVLYNENRKNWQKDGKEMVQKSYDSKVILIVGHWREIGECEGKEKDIKEKTFELFRRDSRNVEIITFDELHERADHIVNHR